VEYAGTYLGVRDVKHVVNVTNDVGSHMGRSDGHRDVPSIQMHAIMIANQPENVSTSPK